MKFVKCYESRADWKDKKRIVKFFFYSPRLRYASIRKIEFVSKNMIDFNYFRDFSDDEIFLEEFFRKFFVNGEKIVDGLR